MLGRSGRTVYKNTYIGGEERCAARAHACISGGQGPSLTGAPCRASTLVPLQQEHGSRRRRDLAFRAPPRGAFGGCDVPGTSQRLCRHDTRCPASRVGSVAVDERPARGLVWPGRAGLRRSRPGSSARVGAIMARLHIAWTPHGPGTALGRGRKRDHAFVPSHRDAHAIGRMRAAQ